MAHTHFHREIGLRPGTQEIVTRALTIWTVGSSVLCLNSYSHSQKYTWTANHAEIMKHRWRPVVLCSR